MEESTATTLLLDDTTVRSVFDWEEAVAALRAAYATVPEDFRFPGRTMARGDHSWLRTLSGVPADPALMGVKIIAAAPGAGPGAGRASYLIPLFDQRTTQLVALLDGHSVTGYRTAATSALAADLLAGPGPVSVAVLGSGFEAMNHVRALAAGRAVESVHVYSPRSESRARFAERLSDLAAPVATADSAEAAVEKATLVICAARSRDESPTLHGAWLRPGMTVMSIGSTLPEQREVDSEVLVPGHGPGRRGDEVPALLDDLDAYVAWLGEIASAGLAEGLTALQLAEHHRDNPFAQWQEPERIVGNLHRAYSELSGHPIDRRLRVPDVWPEMVAFHGGPIGCLA